MRDAEGNHATVEAQYVIAADGPRSQIRESLGIEVSGPGGLGSQLGIYFHAGSMGARVVLMPAPPQRNIAGPVEVHRQMQLGTVSPYVEGS